MRVKPTRTKFYIFLCVMIVIVIAALVLPGLGLRLEDSRRMDRVVTVSEDE
ncbi:MAG: hypothetical protein IJU67_04730 [Lachnospiraceae bacterium]|nr:hypothetical protein [Lachnospiraceae bacterium]MBQ1399172.1 hypothetical protein [Lachnospiraceae bacterium]MBQ1514724.1 hypothetical protein [Lachnospiraceae bacterium]MBQ3400302.1 hypothetical protein [Lachnospiraceae bacterium]MBQ9464568.1 hypothetical protein [Lachnospiraceae bacterium]